MRDCKKGDDLESVILAVDPERERISLGIKRARRGIRSTSYVAANGKGAVVKGTVTAVEAKGATVKLGNDIEGYLRAADIARERIEDARSVLKEGDEVEAKITTIDRKNRKISLSIRAKDMQEETEAVQEYSRKTATGMTSALGDKLKEKLDGQERPFERSENRRAGFSIGSLDDDEIRTHQSAGRSPGPASAPDVELAVKELLEQMSAALARGERIEVRGFGSFHRITARRAPAAIPKPAPPCRCRTSSFPISSPARNCGSA